MIRSPWARVCCTRPRRSFGTNASSQSRVLSASMRRYSVSTKPSAVTTTADAADWPSRTAYGAISDGSSSPFPSGSALRSQPGSRATSSASACCSRSTKYVPWSAREVQVSHTRAPAITTTISPTMSDAPVRPTRRCSSHRTTGSNVTAIRAATIITSNSCTSVSHSQTSAAAANSLKNVCHETSTVTRRGGTGMCGRSESMARARPVRYTADVLSALIVALTVSQEPARPSFAEWLAGVRSEAIARGVRAEIVDAALADVTEPQPIILERDRAQAETVFSLEKYIARSLTPRLILAGRAAYANHRELVDQNQPRGQAPRD